MQQRTPRSLVFYMGTLLTLLVLGFVPSMTGQAAAYNIPNGDVAALINAINQANATAGKDEINLAAGGTYTFNAIDNEYMEMQNNKPVFFGANALPQINSNIIINGNGATLQRDPLFSSCNASNELRLFWVNGTGKLTLNNVKAKNGCVGDYGSGGAVYARGGSTVSVFGSTFENNVTTGIVLDGGAITVDEGFLFVENSNFTGNKSTYIGGAISLDSSTGVIYNSNFTSNSNTSSGGAVGGDWNSDVTISNSTFVANTANSGGALVSRNSSKMRVTKSTFMGNQTVYDGGAMNNEGGTAIITGSTFSGNIGSTAGAVSNDNATGVKMYIFNSTFTDNVAQGFGGGAINNGGEELFIFNSTFTGNSSPDTDFGGGALYHYLGSATLMNVTMTGNTSLAEGGAIYSSGDFLNITRSNISNNSAANGGALETYTTLTNIHSSTLNNNIADNGDGMYSGYGGAVSNSNVMTIVNSTIAGNWASGYESFGGDFKHPGGGAIYTTTDNVAPKPTLTLINTTVSGNSTDTLGGAIFVDEYGDLELRSTTIVGNSAKYAGGGLARVIDDIFPEDADVIGIARSIIVGNTVNGSLQDCDNQDYNSAGNNVLGSSCPTKTGDTVSNNAAAVVSPLANNGGFTLTHALVNGSPAINKGGAGCTNVDQRGYTRAGACDAGAFELNGTATNAPGLVIAQSGGSTVVAEGGATDTYTVQLASAPANLVTVRFYSDGEVNVSPSTLVITPQNWNVPQSVTVTAAVDYIQEPAHAGLIGHTLTSTDPMYNAAPTTLLQVMVAADTGGGGGTETPPPPPPAGELLTNGGFEAPGASGGEAANWKLKNSTSDKRKCNKPDKTVARAGQCAFQFKGGAGENSSIVQTISNVTLQPINAHTLSVWVQAKKAVNGAVISAKVIYTDGTKDKLNLSIEGGTYNYKQIAGNVPVVKAANKVKVSVKNKMGSGKILLDDVSLKTIKIGGMEENDGLLDLPVGLPEAQEPLPSPEASFSSNQ